MEILMLFPYLSGYMVTAVTVTVFRFSTFWRTTIIVFINEGISSSFLTYPRL